MTEPEKLLRALLEGFYYSEISGGILWGWREDVTVGEALGKELEKNLRAYLKPETGRGFE